MDSKQLHQLFTSFNKLNVLIVGDVMLDSYVWGTVNRISPEAPVPIVAAQKRENRLGGAANVALNIKAMGAKPILCSVIGNDSNGKLFSQLIKKEQLTAEGIIIVDDRPTTSKTRIIGNHHQMLRIDEEVTNAISDAQSKKLFQLISKILSTKKIDALIFEDYDKGVLSKNLIEELIKLAKKNSIPTSVDPKKSNFLAYKNVTLFKPNLRELKEGLKLETDLSVPKNLKNAIQLLSKTLNCSICLITLSERGIYIAQSKSEYWLPAHIRTISDVSGAGDTVIAVATLCLAAQSSLEFMAALANLAGGLVCEKLGVVSVDKQQLLEEAKQLI
ncbi:MAG: D-glycero-beta-D-manno-heptose-7-phosphate kinase [Bacteroidetes bacterium]|nr:D-glycero-beta-D-manno-heptose-7-phosphate kinase [Bacteroidota bacterium]MBK9673251.1 D-glycero-beta-D-manno-heptose-7-phosphate kinase [Bacteroidota bacterium]MBP6413667.1 D-glycero-beta-D-manno-heptose-7-phosphate kinase [Bacteroidia bacterium]